MKLREHFLLNIDDAQIQVWEILNIDELNDTIIEGNANTIDRKDSRGITAQATCERNDI